MKNSKTKSIKALFAYILLFAMVVLLAVSMLFAGSFLPQGMIMNNTADLLETFYYEGPYPTSADHSPGTTQDNWTDALILLSSIAMNRQEEDSVLKNPYYGRADADSPVESLYMYMNGEEMNTGHYVRYWMGFRWIVRALLCVFNFMQIRRYLVWGFFLLITFAAGQIAKKLNFRAAFCFVLSIILINPHIVCSSMQFSCCFIIAMLSMLLMPSLSRRREFCLPFFMVLGMLTQYFDFYTSPVITLGYPMVYLYMLCRKQDEEFRLGAVLGGCGMWLLGYVGMWLSKLLLTSLFTDIDAFGDGLSAFAYRLGIGGKTEGQESMYSPITAMQKVWDSVAVDLIGGLVIAAALMLLLAALLYLRKKGSFSFKPLGKQYGLMILALLPFVWFAVAAQPTVIHNWFQYRNIALTYWAMGSMLCTGFITE